MNTYYNKNKSKSKHIKFLTTLAEGLTAYITYESRCGMSPAYTEYLMYGPFVRICNDKGWKIISEELVDKEEKDYRRIDFHLIKSTKIKEKTSKIKKENIYIEIKWFPFDKKNKRMDLIKDIEKLRTKSRKWYTERYLFLIGTFKGEGLYKSVYKNLSDVEPILNTKYDSVFTKYGTYVLRVNK